MGTSNKANYGSRTELRRWATKNDLTFKAANATYDGKTTYAFYKRGTKTRVSSRLAMRDWTKHLKNSTLETQLGGLDLAVPATPYSS